MSGTRLADESSCVYRCLVTRRICIGCAVANGGPHHGDPDSWHQHTAAIGWNTFAELQIERPCTGRGWDACAPDGWKRTSSGGGGLGGRAPNGLCALVVARIC